MTELRNSCTGKKLKILTLNSQSLVKMTLI